MAHTYASNFIHCIFSTKDRRPLIAASRTTALYTYLGGIARDEGFSLLAAGGTANHVHLLFVLPLISPSLTPFKNSKEARPDGWAEISPGRKDMEHSALAPRR